MVARPLVIKQGRFVAIVAESLGPLLATATAMPLMIDLISLGSDAPISAIVVMVSQLLVLLLIQTYKIQVCTICTLWAVLYYVVPQYLAKYLNILHSVIE